MWLYVKTWENLGQHVIDQDQMWNFGEKDLKEAIIEISYPTKKNSEENDLVESLRKLILGKFKDKEFEFYQWSRKIYDEPRENIPKPAAKSSTKRARKDMSKEDADSESSDSDSEDYDSSLNEVLRSLKKKKTIDPAKAPTKGSTSC